MIKVQSFIQDKNSLIPVEVELTLWPGLPCIQFVGLPDQHLKESAIRIKSAIKSCGFQFPVAQQILVNLRPSYKKKTSRGLELAVAAAFLWETGQMKRPPLSTDLFIYGELSLAGAVLEPEDLALCCQAMKATVLTGESVADQSQVQFHRRCVRTLRDLDSPIHFQGSEFLDRPERPLKLLNKKFSRSQARLLEIIAVGEHSALLAGPSGSGKSTMVASLPALLKEPSDECFAELKQIHKVFGENLNWRPTVSPHHSTPVMSMIGGGLVPFAGEISRAHGGVLILDELLEFAPQVQEALREPFEEGKVRIARAGKLMVYPAKALILATTNLCPCGAWTPLKSFKKNCSLSRSRCQSYAPRLSGPLVDRFELIQFTERIGQLEIEGKDLLVKIQGAQEFSLQRQKEANSRIEIDSIYRSLRNPLAASLILEEETSQRRKLALLRVAKTLADLDLSEWIESHHWDEAIGFCQTPFVNLKRWD